MNRPSRIKVNKITPIAYIFGILLLGLSCKNSSTPNRPNILLLCIDDLRPELNSFGASYISSPNIDQLARDGISFLKHYVNAPTCGASRYTLLTGQYGPRNNQALMQRGKKIEEGKHIDPSMPEWFRQNGYTTVSVGKVSHHPGGWGGEDWNDTTILEMPKAWDRQIMPVAEWKTPRGMMHGLAHGEVRVKAGDMDVFQSEKGSDDIYPDGMITNAALKQLHQLTTNNQTPFFLAVGILKPHLPFGSPQKYMDTYDKINMPPIQHPHKPEGRSTWHPSHEFMKYNRWGRDPNHDLHFADEVRRHYAACVSYADALVGKILAELKRTGADKNTIVVLWGDHGWHLGEHAIWGKHSLYEESLRSPLIIACPPMKNKGEKTEAIVETIDIFPTLCDLVGIDIPTYVHGETLRDILENTEKGGREAISYKNGATTIRTKRHRLTLHNDGYAELYDHTSQEKETKNIADDNPEIVNKLKTILTANLQE